MSTSKSLLLEYEEIPEGTSELPEPELALSLSNELFSSAKLGIKAGLPSLAANNPDAPGSEPQALRAPSSSSLSNPQPHSHERSSANTPGISPPINLSGASKDIQSLIIRSFAPRIAVYASEDTEKFISGKGFEDGLYSLIRPYGERLQGKVVIRDSIGGSKAWDDFGVRFVNSQQVRHPSQHRSTSGPLDPQTRSQVNGSQQTSEERIPSQPFDSRKLIDQVLDHSLKTEDGDRDGLRSGYFDYGNRPYESQSESFPFYLSYLHKLLSNTRLVPYETFSHPVACVIAVSSHHPAPIEALRQLYASTNGSSSQTPAWVGTEFLRYYVLIHDEGKDDITKSTALYDLMKRHFGLHCHLLRLRSSQCVQTDDDSSEVPSCEWLSAEEQVERIRKNDYSTGLEMAESYIFESDATAIRMFLREMVSQSVVPFMENRVMTWNDQVASRRRGISGRFMSLSKRWTGFGSSKNPMIGSGATATSSGSNYNYQQGFYPPETPEATMRQLADYAFMLRDWKLAYSTYDFLRTDFSHDKAWAYHAAANEMAAITMLLTPQALNSRSRLESIDKLLENATYSYQTRCSMPMNVVRCLTLATELLKARDSVAVDDVARWGARLLELGVLTLFGQTMMTERLANSYAFRSDAAMPLSGNRRRHAAFWNLLASDCWMRLDGLAQASSRLRSAGEIYGSTARPNVSPPFASMQPLWQRLDKSLRVASTNETSDLINLGDMNGLDSNTYQESERLNGLSDKAYFTFIDTEGFTTQDAQHQDT